MNLDHAAADEQADILDQDDTSRRLIDRACEPGSRSWAPVILSGTSAHVCEHERTHFDQSFNIGGACQADDGIHQVATLVNPWRSESSEPRHHNPSDGVLTLQEACRFLRIPEGTLPYWRHRGTGPRSFKVGRHVRYWRTDRILWLTEQPTRPNADQ